MGIYLSGNKSGRAGESSFICGQSQPDDRSAPPLCRPNSTFQLPSSQFLPDPLENAADDEKVVEHREDDEKSVENEALHLLRAEDRDGDGLRQKHRLSREYAQPDMGVFIPLQ